MGRHPKVRMRVESSAAGPGARQCRRADRARPCPRGSAAGAGLGDQAELAGAGDGLGAVGRAELAQQVADVLFDRVEADHQLRGDPRVRRARRQQHQDFQLAVGQRLDQARHRRGGISPRARPRHAWPGPKARRSWAR